MIISHRHKFIFIKTRKTASTAMEIALSSICGPMDVLTPLSGNDEQVRFEFSKLNAQNFKLSFKDMSLGDWLRFIKRQHLPQHTNHQSAKLTKQRVGNKLWSEYFTFCLEREPYSKVRSHYQWLKMQGRCTNPEDYAKKQYFRKIQGSRLYADSTGKVMVDKVYQMESMHKVLNDIEKRLQLAPKTLQLPPNKVKKSVAIEATEETALRAYYEQHLKPYFELEGKF